MHNKSPGDVISLCVLDDAGKKDTIIVVLLRFMRRYAPVQLVHRYNLINWRRAAEANEEISISVQEIFSNNVQLDMHSRTDVLCVRQRTLGYTVCLISIELLVFMATRQLCWAQALLICCCRRFLTSFNFFSAYSPKVARSTVTKF